MSFYHQVFDHLKIEIRCNHQLWVYLDNVDQMNAISLSMIDSLTNVLNHADFDKEIRVIVLSGRGKNFCAGGDIKAMEEKSGMFAGESNELRMRYMHGIQRIPKCIEQLSTPLVAMVNGSAIGAGCDLAMMCDLRTGDDKTHFAETFTKMGLVPGDGGTFFLSRVLGYSKAMQMLLTAQNFKGKEAFDFGLLNYFFNENLEKSTLELATQIASLAPMAQAMTKKAMKLSFLSDHLTVLDTLAGFQAITQRSADHFEALNAFKEKRSPQFKSE